MKLKKLLPLHFLLITFLSIFILSCKKEPVVVTETVTITDTVTVNTTELVQDTATVFILIRHAETTGIGTNPNLSTAGQDRANELVSILGNITLSAVYSTNYIRTTQTATPISTDKSLSIQNYNPSALETFVDDNLPVYKGKTILVVGHSNTTPDLLNILVGSTIYSDILETEYDNMFIVTSYQKGNSEVLHMKYGQ